MGNELSNKLWNLGVYQPTKKERLRKKFNKVKFQIMENLFYKLYDPLIDFYHRNLKQKNKYKKGNLIYDFESSCRFGVDGNKYQSFPTNEHH